MPDLIKELEERKIVYKEEAYKIIGACIEVHKILGRGFNEVVYKDALEHEFSNRNITFGGEKQFVVNYKSTVLRHKYNADFILFDKIILEVKAQQCGLGEENIKQVLNYLAISKCKLGILVNFGDDSLIYKRIVL